MIDKDLLEFAAKAYGIFDELEWFEEPYGNCWVHGSKEWNPLTDDGDALRLAVKLGMTVISCMEEKEVGVTVLETDLEIYELHNDDPYATTRRAIVRAAAEIGKNL